MDYSIGWVSDLGGLQNWVGLRIGWVPKSVRYQELQDQDRVFHDVSTFGFHFWSVIVSIFLMSHLFNWNYEGLKSKTPDLDVPATEFKHSVHVARWFLVNIVDMMWHVDPLFRFWPKQCLLLNKWNQLIADNAIAELEMSVTHGHSTVSMGDEISVVGNGNDTTFVRARKIAVHLVFMPLHTFARVSYQRQVHSYFVYDSLNCKAFNYMWETCME